MIVMVFVSSIFHQLFLVKASSGTNLSFIVTNKQQLSFLHLESYLHTPFTSTKWHERPYLLKKWAWSKKSHACIVKNVSVHNHTKLKEAAMSPLLQQINVQALP